MTQFSRNVTWFPIKGTLFPKKLNRVIISHVTISGNQVTFLRNWVTFWEDWQWPFSWISTSRKSGHIFRKRGIICRKLGNNFRKLGNNFRKLGNNFRKLGHILFFGIRVTFLGYQWWVFFLNFWLFPGWISIFIFCWHGESSNMPYPFKLINLI